MKKFKIFKSIFTLLILAFLFIGCGVLLAAAAGKVYIIKTGSMTPVVPTGALAFVLTKYSYGLGDVIAFVHPADPEKIIVHRIVATSMLNGVMYFSTKGDHNPTEDFWRVSSATVKGQVVYVVPWLGYFTAWAKSVLGFVLLVGGPGLILLVLSILRIRNGIEEIAQRRAWEMQGVKVGVVALVMLSVGVSEGYAMYSASVQIKGLGISTASSFVISGNTGNGEGSTNTVIINETNTTTVNQSNSGSQSTTVIVNQNGSGESVMNVNNSQNSIWGFVSH
jgi:signal peptidase I